MSDSKNVFATLGIEPAFVIDEKAVEAAYFTQQRATHPDRFIGKPDIERARAMQASADANDAYRILKTPLLRAQALLRMQGIIVGTEKDTVKPTPSLLMESMQWREAIDDAQKPEELTRAITDIEEAHQQTLKAIETSYAAKEFEKMAAHTLRLGYILKAQEAASAKHRQKVKAAL